MVLSDDSGLQVDVLGGLPGVWSARFAGPEATDAENNAKLLHELAMVLDDSKRSAQFHTTLVVAAPGRDSLVVDADWKVILVENLKVTMVLVMIPFSYLVIRVGQQQSFLQRKKMNNLTVDKLLRNLWRYSQHGRTNNNRNERLSWRT